MDRTLFIRKERAFAAALTTMQFVSRSYRGRLAIDVKPVTVKEPGQAPECGYHARIVDQDGRVVAFA